MNTRLKKEYSSIEESNTEAFLNNNINIDTMWGNDIFGVTLQIDLATNIKDRIAQYQHELEQQEPSNFLFPSSSYQHISLNQVVYWNGNYKKGTGETWKLISTNFTNAFRQLDKALHSFPITFSRLIATKSGIIWCAFDANDEMEHLREILLKRLDFPADTTKRNHIIHTTIARFKNHLNNPQHILEYVRNHDTPTTMPVTSITLKKELVFPSIETQTVAKIHLI